MKELTEKCSCKKLIGNGANPLAVNKFGVSILDCAQSHPAVVEFLKSKIN